MKQTKRILHLILSGALFAGLLIWLCLSQDADIFSGLLMTCLVYTAIHMAIKGIFSLAGVEVFNNVCDFIDEGGTVKDAIVMGFFELLITCFGPLILLTIMYFLLPTYGIAWRTMVFVLLYLNVLYPWVCDIACIVAKDDVSDVVAGWHLRIGIGFGVLLVVAQIVQICIMTPKVEAELKENTAAIVAEYWERFPEEYQYAGDNIVAALEEEGFYKFKRFSTNCKVSNSATLEQNGVKVHIYYELSCEYWDNGWAIETHTYRENWEGFSEPHTYIGTGVDNHTTPASQSTCKITFENLDWSSDEVTSKRGYLTVTDESGNVVFESGFTAESNGEKDGWYLFAGALDEPRKGGFMSFATLNIRYNPTTDSMQLYDMYSVSMERQK